MQKLTDLADYIARYNMLGRLKLTSLKIAIIQNKDHEHIAQKILTQMGCIQTQSFGNLIGIGGYKHYRTNSIKNVEVHLIDSLYGEEALEDREFLKRKKHLQTFRTNKEIILIHLSDKKQFKEQAMDRSEIFDLKRIDLSIKKDTFWKGNFKLLFQDIIKTWQAINRCQIICCLEDSKMIAKELAKDEKRQNQWLQLSDQLNDPTPYVLKLYHTTSRYLVSSFQGFYSSESHHFMNNYSIHWQIMDILEDLWKEQGQRINYQLEKMPLSYIQDILRLNDYNTIGGFLPESCFLKIFKPILQQTSYKIFTCLEAAKFKIMHNVQMVYEYYFTKTSFKEQLILLETNQIQKICNSFLKQMENAINSQISYVYAPSSVFWEMRGIKSQLYGPEQQANIEIKYIGKVYVKRVFDSIRQSVPRYIGQGLLRKISRYISEHSLQNLFDVLKEVPFKIMLTKHQKEVIQHKKTQKVECQKIIKFLSLKVSSTYLLKNVQEKMERSWKQMYKNSADEQERKLSQKITQNSKAQGFFKRMKRFFIGDQNQQTKIRSKSIDKNEGQTKVQILDVNEKINTQPVVVSNKTWILVLYGNKKLDDMKVIIASCEGFPQKLRPSIWFWICSKRNEEQIPHKLVDLLNKKQMDAQIAIQIKKDLGRTPPSQLFKKKYRDSLRRVLSAYSLIDLQIQYTQGMNFVVSVIISTLIHYGIKDDYLSQSSQKINIDDMQQKAFIIFHYLMVRRGFRKLMFIEREYIAQICFKLQQRIRELNEKVAMMIQKSGFTCEIIFGPLIISGLFTWSSNNEIKKRIFDLVLCRGIDILYQIVAGVTVMCEIELAKYKSEMVYDFLRNKALDVFYNNFGQSGLTNIFNSF